MAVTIRDLARELNLSHATVSFVLNDRRDVTIPETTRKRVLDKARQMGYVPNRAARALASGRSNIIAVWQTSTHLPYYAWAFHHLQRAITNRRFGVLFCEEREPMSPMSWPVDGVICVDQTVSPAMLRSLPDIPIVSMGGYPDPELDHVRIGLFSGSVQGLMHLLEIGCRRIAYLGPWDGDDGSEDRKAAYKMVIESAGLPMECILTPSQSVADVRTLIREHLAKHGAFDGLFCYNDFLALGAMQAICDLGLRIGRDIAVCGFDGLPIGDELSVPLTTVRQPIPEACELALDLLLRRMADPTAERKQLRIECELVPRESTKRHPSLNAAL